MSADPGPRHRLLKLFYIFFLRVLNRIFSTKPQQEPDDEARIDLPANIIRGERLPAWMTEPPKGSKETDSSRPLRHSEECAQQTADFLRSPNLKKKYTQYDTDVRARGPRVRFSGFLVEHPRTPSDECLQGFSLPPTIRIEDWSNPPSPEASSISVSESLLAAGTPFPQPKFVSTSSKGSPPDSPGFKRGCRALGSRQAVAIGTRQIHESSRSNNNPEKDHGRKHHDKKQRSSPKKSLQLREQGLEPDGSTLPKLVRPARTSKSLLSPSLLDLLQMTSLPTDGTDSVVQQAAQEADKQETTAYRNRIQHSFPTFQSLANIRVSQQRQRKSNKARSVFKRHHSLPSSTGSIAHFRNGANAAIPFSTEMCKVDLAEAKDYYRHSIDVVSIPTSMGIMLSLDVQTAILTRFHEKGLATAPERCSSGFRRQILLHPSGKLHQSSAGLSSDAADVPYPDVFDLDEYFQDLSPSPVPAISILPGSTSQTSSCRNRSQDSFDTPSPSPRTLSSDMLLSLRASGPRRTHQNCEFPALLVDKRKNERIMHKTTTHERKLLTWSYDTDEEQQHPSRSVYSSESGSSGDLPLSSWLSQPLQSQGRSDKRKGFIDVTRRVASVNPDKNSVSNLDPARHVKSATRKNGQPEMEQIRAGLRSHYVLTQRQRFPFYESSGGGENDDSLVYPVESYGSGSTLSHHYHPHQWTDKGPPSPRQDQRLDPVIEVTSESECSSGMIPPKVAPPPPFGSEDNIMTVDRTPPSAWTLRPPRPGSGDNIVSLRFDPGIRGQSKTARETNRGEASGQHDGGVPIMNENAPRMQEKAASPGTSTKKSTRTRSKLVGMCCSSSLPPRPVGRKVAPQKF